MISLFISGGVSHLDTFQYKPALEKYDRMPIEGRGEIKWQAGSLPAVFQGTVFRSKGDPILDLSAPDRI
jgi:hypothetical protein